MEKALINTEFITLGQLLKYKGIVSSGAEVKSLLLMEKVLVNGEADNRRGRKLYKGDRVLVEGKEFIIEKE